MHFKMKAYTEGAVLAGSIAGTRTFGDLVSKTLPPSKPELCFLDFANIALATTSFLRDSVVAYRNHARSQWPAIYPVAANITPETRDEFEPWLVERGDAFVMCKLSDDGQASDATVIGQIDGKQLVALQGVLALGETDVSGLASFVKEEVAPTAWNNRLAALVAKGILIEISSGRSKRYRPVLEGLKYGA